MMAPDSRVDRVLLLNQLEGTQADISKIKSVLEEWPSCVHPEVVRLRQDLRNMVPVMFGTEALLPRLMKYDVALFAASWWPYAAYDKLLVAALMSLWMFVWDDATDTGRSLDKAGFVADSDFRARTASFVNTCLQSNSKVRPDSKPENPLIAAFSEVGERLAQTTRPDEAKVISDRLAFAIRMTEEEQTTAKSTSLPLLQEYQARRKGTSAVDVLLVLNEYCRNIHVPCRAQYGAYRELELATNAIISIVNDILSIEKEYADSMVDSLLPILYLETGSLQAAVDRAMCMLRDEYQRFKAASVNFVRECEAVGNSLIGKQEAEMLISGFQLACTANLSWSLQSGRYQRGLVAANGPLQIRLEACKV